MKMISRILHPLVSGLLSAKKLTLGRVAARFWKIAKPLIKIVIITYTPQKADVIVYSGSLIPPEILKYNKKGKIIGKWMDGVKQ